LLLQKVKQVLDQHVVPIFCCGEPQQVREAGNYKTYIGEQLTNSVFQLEAEAFARIVIAYEPIWAIGTGKTATPDQAREVHEFIRQEIHDRYDKTIAGNCSILYGGSVNEKNAAELFACPDIDGALVGGASLKADAFVSIIKSMP
jgi:triosephosphate isomerase